MINEREHRGNPNPRLKFGLAPSFSECAPTRVASRSTTTRPSSETGLRCAQTSARAAARPVRIAAIATAGAPADTRPSLDQSKSAGGQPGVGMVSEP